jgi:phospholipid/cholesterol/gamma-HCH transport system substrate-binding protein
MENRPHALAAGFFVLIFGIATASAIWWFRQDKEEPAYYILETRDGVGGLNEAALVRYRGLRAGKVEKISIDPKDPRLIIVRVSLNKDIELTRGTTATLAMQGLTGLTFVALNDNGQDTTPLTAPAGELPRITLAPTLVDVLSGHAVDTMRQLSSVMARLDGALNDKTTAHLEQLLANVATASEGLRDLPQVMTELRASLRNLQQASVDAKPMVADIRTLITNLSQVSERLDTILSNGDTSQAVLPRVSQLVRDLSETSQQFSRLLENIDDNPQVLLLGRPPVRPGPGEPGFKQ